MRLEAILFWVPHCAPGYPVLSQGGLGNSMFQVLLETMAHSEPGKGWTEGTWRNTEWGGGLGWNRHSCIGRSQKVTLEGTGPVGGKVEKGQSAELPQCGVPGKVCVKGVYVCVCGGGLRFELG